MGCVWKFEGYSESSLSPFSIGHLGVHPPMVPNPSGWTVGPLLAVQNHEGTMILDRFHTVDGCEILQLIGGFCPFCLGLSTILLQYFATIGP
jgi:hypothetical protein